MSSDDKRCSNCGTPLMAEDTSCPSCGAPVILDAGFPKPEEFVHPSYQNIDPEPPVILSTPEPASIVEPVDFPETPKVPVQEFSATPDVITDSRIPAKAGNNPTRFCLLLFAAIFFLTLCCLIVTGIILWNIGDALVGLFREILNSFGIFL
jgi:hypothetical protein